MKKTLAALAVLLALPLVALAQKPVSLTDAVELTTKIDAIDHTSRMVTLKDKAGETETIYCGSKMKQFDELKVNDTVTFRYQETIKAIDEKVPSVTVLTEDRRTVSFKVDDKNNLKDVKVGDKVEITYTEAVMISVK